MKPLHNLVLVKREERPREANGLILPETMIEGSLWVKVLAVGPGEFVSKGRRKKMYAEGQEGKLMLLRQWCQGTPLEEVANSPFFITDDLLEAIQVE